MYCDKRKSFFNGLFRHLCIINHYVVIVYASCGKKDLLPWGNTMQWRVNSLSFFNTRQHLQTLSILWDFLFDSLLWSCSSASHNMLRNQGVDRENSIADILHSPGGNSRALAIYSTFTIIWLMVEMSERRQHFVQFTDVGPLLWREWIIMTGWKRPLRHEYVMLTLQLPFSCLCLSLSVVFSLILSFRQVALIFDEHRNL